MAKAKLTKDDVKEYIKNMPVFELAELVKELEEETGSLRSGTYGCNAHGYAGRSCGGWC